MGLPKCRVPSLPPTKWYGDTYKMVAPMGVAAYKMVAQGTPPAHQHQVFWVNIVSKKLWKMGEPFCKTQSNPVVAPWSFLGDQFVDSSLWMKFLKISEAILAYRNFLHLVHLAIGFHKVSSNRSSQIDWTEVVVIVFFLDRGWFQNFGGFENFAIISSTKSTWSVDIFFFKYIYICGCIYQLPLPIYKMVFQIFYKMEVPDTGIWSCSHIKWCWVCINRSLSTKWSAPTAK